MQKHSSWLSHSSTGLCTPQPVTLLLKTKGEVTMQDLKAAVLLPTFTSPNQHKSPHCLGLARACGLHSHSLPSRACLGTEVPNHDWLHLPARGALGVHSVSPVITPVKAGRAQSDMSCRTVGPRALRHDISLGHQQE